MKTPRRIELPVKHKGADILVVARENNDGFTVAYVYALTPEEKEKHDTGTIALSTGYDEDTFGDADFEGVGRAYNKMRDTVWAEAQESAHLQAKFLQDA